MKASALTLLAAASPAFAAVHELWWNLTYVENANPDGLQPRRVIGVNGTWPSVSLYLPRVRLVSDSLTQASADRGDD